MAATGIKGNAMKGAKEERQRKRPDKMGEEEEQHELTKEQSSMGESKSVFSPLSTSAFIPTG